MRIALRIEAHLAPVRKRDRGPGNVRGDKLVTHAARPGKRRRGRGQDRLALIVEDMLGAAQRVAQGEGKAALERVVFGNEALDGLLAQIQDLRVHPGRRLPHLAEHVARLRLALLRGGRAHVFVGLERGIDVDAHRLELGHRDIVQRARQRLCVPSQCALVGGKTRQGGEDGLARRIPGLGIREEGGQVPGSARS